MNHSLNVNDMLGYQVHKDRTIRYQIKKIDSKYFAEDDKLAIDLLPIDEDYAGIVSKYPVVWPLEHPWVLVQKYQLEEYI